MACSSIQTSSSSRTRNFDVFVSFRGADTRNGFTDHLFAALQRKGVVAFRDDHKIKKGGLLEPELLQAIEGSRVFIVVFSKDYASSTWCMKELTKIVGWVEETGRSVLPIFYDVTPSEVRKQSGKFEKAFIEHDERFKDDLEMVHKWREALKAITNRCGWDIQNKPQNEEIEKIVEEVINILGHNQILSFGDDLVDMHFRVKQMKELLELDANEVVRMVGICGMGGIGKTTLATALFNNISPQYDACCFIDDISKIYGNFGQLGVQKQLLCQALNQENIEINGLSQGTMLLRTRLCNVKTLIVIDNVNQVEQLEKLALHPKYLGAGSRIIIISRNCHILRNYGVNEVYNVQLLNMNKALQLFCKKAFKFDYILNDYEKLTFDVLKYANGLPLAIKVLGSFLFGRDFSEWQSALARLKENPNKDIMNVLQISFDGLERMEKEIFLDIACFFPNEFLKEVKEFLAIRGFYPDIGMKVLIEKSLISCGPQHIHMHDLLKELGRNIVREKSPNEPRKWSRLWKWKDLHHVMMENKDLPNLRRLDLSYSKNLIELSDFRGGPHLKRLDLQGCEEIVRIDPSIGYLKELTFLNLKNCKNLVLDLSVIFQLNSLEELNLSGCSKMQISHLLKKPRETKILENDDKSKSFIQFTTSSAIKVLMLPFHFLSSQKPEESFGLLLPYLPCFPCLLKLDLSFCNLLQIPDAIGNLHSLVSLNLGGNKFLALPTTIKQLSKLQHLNLEHCKQLKYLPELPTTKEKTFNEHFWRGIYVFDCPKLSELEHCYRMVFSWMIQRLEVYLRSTHSWGMSVVIPGTEIPRWFSDQNEGSSISMDLTPIMDDPNWIGVACCALFVAHYDTTDNFNNRWQHEQHDDGYHHIGFGVQNVQNRCCHVFTVPILFKRDLVTVGFENLLIMFYPREILIRQVGPSSNGLHDTDTLKVRFDSGSRPGLHLVEKAFGYRFLFQKDLQQFQSSIMFIGNSSSKKRKLLTSD